MSSIEQDWFPTHLRVTVIGARNLRAKRKKSLNNCYTVIRLGPEKYMTSVKGATLNPEWKEECTLPLPLILDNSDRWTLHVTVKHNNTRYPLDDFLGRVNVAVAGLYENKNRRKNEWHDLQSKPAKLAKDRGQIQLAFQFLRDNMTPSAYELSKGRPQSVFDKFKDKVASLKYGMTHEILPPEGPSTLLRWTPEMKQIQHVIQLRQTSKVGLRFIVILSRVSIKTLEMMCNLSRRKKMPSMWKISLRQQLLWS
ncbi:rab11 family-interacting protein 2-like isoform X2 [Rhinoraja longicauda]